MATICVQGATSEVVFESVQAVLFDKDGTLADVASYLTALGNARAQQIGACMGAADGQTEDGQTGNRQTEDGQTKTRSAVYSAVLAAFGFGSAGLDPAGLLAVGSRYENEIAVAACLATVGWGWIEAVAAVKSAFSVAETALAPKVEKTPLLPGADYLLHQLNAAQVKVGVVSSDIHSEVCAFVKHFQLTEVDWYCGAAVATLPKIHPDFLKFACQAVDVVPSATLVIGDSAADYALSTHGAMGFIGMVGGWDTPPLIEPSIPTISRLSQVEVFN